MKNFISWSGRIVYGIISISLTLISLLMIIVAVLNVWNALFDENILIVTALLDAIGLIVIGMAVFDVSNFLLEEEVYTRNDTKSPAKQRSTLIKFFIIISIAVSLEALMFVFHAGKTDISTLIFPTFLLISSVLIIIGLGIYQWLTLKESHQ